MEDFENKLKQNNPISIVQAITKLITTIKQKKISQQCGRGKNVSTTEIPELQLLKSKCGDGNPMISITASQGLVQLVEEGILPVGATLSDLILNLSTAKCFGGITMALGKLILLDMRRSLEIEKSYNCPFNLQKNQHPFIKVLMGNQDIWLEVYTQMQMFVDHFDEKISENSVELLRPVFFFILCKPTNKLCATSRLRTLKLLITINNSTAYELIFQILSCVQLNSRQDVLDICDYLQEISRINKNNPDMSAAIILYLSSMLCRIIQNGDNPISYINTILYIIDHDNCDNTHSVILFMLTQCIEICSPIYLEHVLRLCNTIISKKHTNILSMKCVASSLLNWILYPSILLNERLIYAKEILNLIENNNEYSNLTNTLSKNVYFKYVLIGNPEIDKATKLSLLTETWQNDVKKLLDWLDYNIETENTEMINIFNFVSAIFIHGFDNTGIVKKALNILTKIIITNKEYASKLLVLIFFKLSNETNPKTQLALLKAIPKMAVLRDNMPLILTILEPLKEETGPLKTILMTLYFELFLTEVRTFPYLQNMLTETNRDPEFLTVKAQTLKEICKKKPELHGKEMVGHLAQTLNKNTDQKGSLVSSLAIDGLTSLCESEIIDIVSTWNNLSPKFSKEKRHLVINSLCNFFGGFADITTISKDQELLKSDVITKLWHYVSYNNHVDTISLALKALSRFNINDITLKQLPDLYRQHLLLPKSLAKTPEEAEKRPEDVLPYVPGECWVQMLQNINHDAMENAGELLAKWIHDEIAEYRSGIYIVPDGKTEPENYNYLAAKSVVRGIGNAVRLTATGECKVPLTNPVLKECLRILGKVYPKPLPPLNWCFLHDLLHKDDEVKRLCINLACKQVLISGSALRLMENYIASFKVTMENILEIKIIFKNLGNLCQAVSTNLLIIDSLQLAYDMAVEEKSEDLFLRLSNDLKNTLKNEKLQDTNRNALGQTIELMCEQMDGTSVLFEKFTDCIVESPNKFVERITNPSLWWETTKDKFERALIIRCKLAKKAENLPFVWLNGCIKLATQMKSVQTYLLRNIIEVFQVHKASLDSGNWLLELLGKIQEALTEDVRDAEQIVYLCDVFLLAVIILAENECYICPTDQIVISKEARLELFSLALLNLVQYKCHNIIVQVLEWLYHMTSCKLIPSNYRRTFHQSLLLLRHEKAFIESSKWMKYMSVKFPN